MIELQQKGKKTQKKNKIQQLKFDDPLSKSGKQSRQIDGRGVEI